MMYKKERPTVKTPSSVDNLLFFCDMYKVAI